MPLSHLPTNFGDITIHLNAYATCDSKNQITFHGAGVIGNVSILEVADVVGDSGECSSWSVVTGKINGTETNVTTTQHHVLVSTKVKPITCTLTEICMPLASN